jgi:hypothetical protein
VGFAPEYSQGGVGITQEFPQGVCRELNDVGLHTHWLGLHRCIHRVCVHINEINSGISLIYHAIWGMGGHRCAPGKDTCSSRPSLVQSLWGPLHGLG